MTPATRTLYIVDDNVDFLESTRFWLSGAGYEVCTWSDPLQAVTALTRRDRRQTACLLLDIRMPRLSGLALHDTLLEQDADLPIIYMSGHADVPLVVQAMQKGAVTVLEKPFDDTTLDTALDRAFATWPRTRHTAAASVATMSVTGLDEGNPAAATMTSAASNGPTSIPALAGDPVCDAPISEARSRFETRHGKLSPRERQVLEHAVRGIYNKNIADLVGLSIKTVELYRARGMAKMQARSIAELTRMMVTREVH